jgi:RHS repeat-associated protein
LGRFIQADPLIDAGTQGLNRYSYVLNNPLTHTDPSGYLSTPSGGVSSPR